MNVLRFLRKIRRIEVVMVLCLIIGSFLNTFFAIPLNLIGWLLMVFSVALLAVICVRELRGKRI